MREATFMYITYKYAIFINIMYNYTISTGNNN